MIDQASIGTTEMVIGIVVVLLVIGFLVQRRIRKAEQPVGMVSYTPPQMPGTFTGGNEVQTLLAQGNKIAAIKAVREQTGLGLKEAKDYVDRLAATPLAAQPPAASPPQLAPAADERARFVQAAQVARELMAQGRKIEAVKQVRQLTGIGLKEAVDFVEAVPSNGEPTVAENERARSAQADQVARDLLAQGRIKQVRQLTGIGLKEAVDFDESVPSNAQPGTASVPTPGNNIEAAAEIARQLLANDNKIAAIREVRGATGMGLKEAKDFVERLERAQGIKKRRL